MGFFGEIVLVGIAIIIIGVIANLVNKFYENEEYMSIGEEVFYGASIIGGIISFIGIIGYVF